MFFNRAILSGRSSFISTNLRARAFSTSFAGIGGKAEASLKGVVLAAVEVMDGPAGPDSSCARLTRGGGLRIAWAVKLELLLGITGAEVSSGTKLMALGGGSGSGKRSRKVNVNVRMMCHRCSSLQCARAGLRVDLVRQQE